jgi:hypothetical protein
VVVLSSSLSSPWLSCGGVSVVSGAATVVVTVVLPSPWCRLQCGGGVGGATAVAIVWVRVWVLVLVVHESRMEIKIKN